MKFEGISQGRRLFALTFSLLLLAVCLAFYGLFFTVATEGLVLASLGALVYGLLGAGITWLATRSVLEGSLLGSLSTEISPKHLRVGETVTVEIAQEVRKDLFLEEVSIGVRCWGYRNKGLRVLHEQDVQVLTDQSACRGETLHLAAEFAIPDKPRLRSRQLVVDGSLEETLWEVVVLVKIAGRRNVQLGTPIEILERGPRKKRRRSSPRRSFSSAC